MIIEAYEEEKENRVWQQYLTVYPNMDEKHFTSYEKFKKDAMGIKHEKTEDVKEILKKAERIRNMDRQRKEVDK